MNKNEYIWNFGLLYSDLIEKFEPDNRIFTHKYVVGKQRIRLHLLKAETEDLDPVEIYQILDFLNKLQEKYSYDSHWSRFRFSNYPLKYQNIMTFEFLSQNEEEIRMYQLFCDLTIS